MLLSPCIQELRNEWLPNVTNAGLDRIIDLLEKGSPLLIHGAFTKALPMGCLATHIAWHHPRTAKLNTDAGITWLSKIAGLNPATSLVIRTWDMSGVKDWDLRNELLTEFRAERDRRNTTPTSTESEVAQGELVTQ